MIASEAWLLGLKTADLNDVLTGTERTSLRPTKAGLLAGLCVPDCGQPQLRFFADFLSLLIIADVRIKRVGNVSDSVEHGAASQSGIDSLGQHDLRPELQRLISRADSSWDTRFAGSVHSYHSAQLQVITARLHNVTPDLDTYLLLRRDLSGFQMFLDLVELSENLTIVSAADETSQRLTILKQLTADIIGCSLVNTSVNPSISISLNSCQDVFAFNNDQAQGNRHNLITILMVDRHLSLQGALNFAGVMIRQMFDSFVEIQQSLFSPSTPPYANHPGSGTLSACWKWITSTRLATPPALTHWPPPTNLEYGGDLASDLPSYVRTLRDCIVGTINWAYETELYFGRKGEEIRTFGWVFLNPKVIGDSEDQA
ncbi:hypothetical protein DXG03_000888 [Asterophora parasitica]|uniref:Uncharacterized protein n=1 Tax=Asterophora parasitica TaxID=117018 RepID=A0A9P7KD40_9AGAR|nr:hypothetical protein DXG03_000888 [Asterophora parasitica]